MLENDELHKMFFNCFLKNTPKAKYSTFNIKFKKEKHQTVTFV